jgi:hypothetical protein
MQRKKEVGQHNQGLNHACCIHHDQSNNDAKLGHLNSLYWIVENIFSA